MGRLRPFSQEGNASFIMGNAGNSLGIHGAGPWGWATVMQAMSQNIRKIYLHWSATHYNWAKPGHYHTIVLGNGTVRRLTGYEQPLSGHTFARNANSVALCVACMGGRGWADFPPTEKQLDNLCKEAALLAYRLKWRPEEITVQRVMTHAEAAANRDYPLGTARRVSGWSLPTSTPQQRSYSQIARRYGLPHENYGPAYWFDRWPGGFVERWDLWQLKASDPPGQGGFTLRDRIKQYLQQQWDRTAVQSFSTQGTKPLRTCSVLVKGAAVSRGLVMRDQRCYVKLGDLTKAYGIELAWNARAYYVNLRSETLRAAYGANAPLILGYPAIDVYLNRPEDQSGEPLMDPDIPVQPVMQGIVIDGATHVLIAEFAEEFGVPIQVKADFSIHLGALPPPSDEDEDEDEQGLVRPLEASPSPSGDRSVSNR